MAEAAAAVGMARSAFFAMRDRWRAVPSVLSLGMGLQPVKTRASKRGAEFKQAVVEAIEVQLADPTLGTNDVLRLIKERFPVGLAKTTVLAWIDDVRRSSSTDRVVGRELSLDLSLIDLLDPGGLPYAVVCVVDVGARLVLGAGLLEHAAEHAYAAAIRDADRRLDDLPLGIFEIAPKLRSFDLQLPSGTETSRFAFAAVAKLRFANWISYPDLSISPHTKRPRGRALAKATDGWLGGLRLGRPRRRSDAKRGDGYASGNGGEARTNSARGERRVTADAAKALLSASMDDYVKDVRATLGLSDDVRDRAARAVLRKVLGITRTP
ncbi:hypothetical protein BW41_03267 [Sphingomonas sp. RIT328]|nr:hypothetical protein BW41_03267 [Sphingomonas sp. RIT328]